MLMKFESESSIFKYTSENDRCKVADIFAGLDLLKLENFPWHL